MQVEQFQVTYCTNVHPGQTLTELCAVLERHVPAVRDELGAEIFGLGLRLGHPVVHTLTEDPEQLSMLKQRCLQEKFDVFTVNGFPYGNFDVGVIKADVYEPDWTTDSRLAYTLRLAEVLAALPGSNHRTISTVAGGFGPKTEDRHVRQRIGEKLNEAAEGLARIADRTGVQIRLCLEPEPWTTLETTDDVVAFWQMFVPETGPVVDHLGLCYDCCHQALHYEDPELSLKAIEDAGIVVGKIQVSSALHLDNPSDRMARERLMKFAESRFLHQMVGRRSDGLVRRLDLSELTLDDPVWLSADSWRCHFHVPIWWSGDENLGTTKRDWVAAVTAAKKLKHRPHLEIETYTWDVIPAAARAAMADGDLVASIVAEFASLNDVIKEVA